MFEALSDDKTISGVASEDIVIRRYPQGRRMSHVLGFVNNMGVGGAGIEQQFNSYLTGTPGLIEGEKDAGRREIFSRRKIHVPPIAGSDIYLTLDHRIQYEVERAIQEVVKNLMRSPHGPSCSTSALERYWRWPPSRISSRKIHGNHSGRPA